MEKLKEFAKSEIKRLREKANCTDKEFILINAIKLSEETGEVSNEILKHFKNARKEKLDRDLKLGDELADVMIVTAGLAELMGVDLNASLERKIKYIKEKYR